MIRESQKRKNCTSAEIFFVPFQRINISEFIPLRILMEDKETPLPFHYLDTLETQGFLKLIFFKEKYFQVRIRWKWANTFYAFMEIISFNPPNTNFLFFH